MPMSDISAKVALACPAIDATVRVLYATGYLHNHARTWLASYVVHVRVLAGRADWLYAHSARRRLT
jgi:deoxyribodipyrimidine photo-lyase